MSKTKSIVAVSGGADSVFLVCRCMAGSASPVLAHLDHGARGRESEADRKFVQRMGEKLGARVEVGRARMRIETGMSSKRGAGMTEGFEERARKARYSFLKGIKEKHGARKILLAHTADDQVETVLMRVLEGAGISGLKGIPRETEDGIERPLLDTWKEDILEYLHKNKIPYRVDKSNFDTRFERNWVRHVLIPLLEKRYGKGIKKRVFVLGERFREIDEFLEGAARKWMKRNIRAVGALNVPRKSYSVLPSVVRKKVLQLLCFERIGIQPNERLLESMDRMIAGSDASARLNIGKSWILGCRYGRAILKMEKKGESSGASHPTEIRWEERGKIPAGNLKRLAIGERTAIFDPDAISMPLAVRPLRAGDRIRPFGLAAEKKVKEILIDRKIPREERWGRPAVCDANGTILWIPGVVRSSHAPVTASTRRTAILRVRFPGIMQRKV